MTSCLLSLGKKGCRKPLGAELERKSGGLGHVARFSWLLACPNPPLLLCTSTHRSTSILLLGECGWKQGCALTSSTPGLDE